MMMIVSASTFPVVFALRRHSETLRVIPTTQAGAPLFK
jgi:hypothetical protein